MFNLSFLCRLDGKYRSATVLRVHSFLRVSGTVITKNFETEDPNFQSWDCSNDFEKYRCFPQQNFWEPLTEEYHENKCNFLFPKILEYCKDRFQMF